MGYEVKMIVGVASPYRNAGDTHYMTVDAIIELEKLTYDQNDPLNILIRESHRRDASGQRCHFYLGSEIQENDKYGDVMAAMSRESVIHAMERTKNPGSRVKWALALLRAMPDDRIVLFYGH